MILFDSEIFLQKSKRAIAAAAMSPSLGQQMARTAGIFQGITALPVMFYMGETALNQLYYPYIRFYWFMYVHKLPTPFPLEAQLLLSSSPAGTAPPHQSTTTKTDQHVLQNSSMHRSYGSSHRLHHLCSTPPQKHSHVNILFRDREIGSGECAVVVVNSG